MIQVYILDRCEFCDGQAYIYTFEVIDSHGYPQPRYMPCAYCNGSGKQPPL